jgi:DNA-binding response OmpR family regulator
VSATAVAAVMTMSPVRVLLAEDDDDLRTLIAEELRKDGHEVIEVRNGNQLGELIAAHALGPRDTDAIVISDIGLPGRSGLSVLERHRHTAWCPRFIFITGLGNDDVSAHALELGALAVVEKPFDLDELRRTLLDAIARGR